MSDNLHNTKEIGVRKALGALTGKIMSMVNMQFIKLVLLANLVACPVSRYFMSRWLIDYPYRVDIGIWAFAAGAATALIIAIASVSYQSYKASAINPVVSLRYE